MELSQYDFNFGAYENIKSSVISDRLAKNRWGAKFKRLYARHMSDTTDGTIGSYDFTNGMRATVTTLPQANSDLDTTLAFKSTLLTHLEVDTGDGFSIDGAMESSYACVLVETVPSTTFSGINRGEVKGFNFSLSLSDDDHTSFFHSFGEDASISCIDYETEHSTDEHYDTILEDRGEEDRENEAFKTNQLTLFEEIEDDLSIFLGLMTKDMVSNTIGSSIAVVVSLSELFSFLEERIELLNSTIETLTHSEGRIQDDLELIAHLSLEETLIDEIDNPHKIRKIWFKFEKKVSPPMIEDENGEEVPDPEYEWWEEEQFQDREENGVTIPGIASRVKNFQEYCTFEGTTVRVNIERMDGIGWKMYWFVNSFLEVGVKAKKPSLLRRIFNFLLLIVSIVLTVISSNPTWLKVVIVGTAVLSYMGVLTPELALLVALLQFGYGISSVDFSTMAPMQIFSWTINNIEMLGKMLSLYDSIGAKKELEQRAKEENKSRSLSQMQESAMTFIFSGAYSQYDNFYDILYNFEPLYKK